MAYRELIKDLQRIRDYMREFYVYGFKSREDYDAKSARSYDNARRRIESWLGGCMSFRRDVSGKRVFLSVDSRQISRDPLYKAFKAKSFTARDITLHFYILDLLADGDALSVREIADGICLLLSHFGNAFSLDESTVRKKLREYEDLGLLRSRRQGREVLYQRTDSRHPDLPSWAQAVSFFSEADPMGVVGSFLLDRLEETADVFRFKHHYLLHVLDSEILSQLLEAIGQHRAVELSVRGLRDGRDRQRTVCPLKIYLSTQTGRQYLLCFYYRGRRMVFFRLDAIRSVRAGSVERRYDTYLRCQEKLDPCLWGVSTGSDYDLDHIEMTVRCGPGEDHILRRLEREKRHGRVEVLDGRTCRFTADVFDAMEMLPWLRTFTGRVTELRCSSPAVTEAFYGDLRRMEALYGGGDDAVP